MQRPSSPTSLLWAHQLRRENTHLLSRLDALEKAFEAERRTHDEEEEKGRVEKVVGVVDEVREEVRGLRERVEVLEGEVERRGKDCDGMDVRVGALERREEDLAGVGEDLDRGELRVFLSVALFSFSFLDMGLMDGVVLVSRRPSRATTVVEEMESERVDSEEDVLFAEIDALEQGPRALSEYLESGEDVFLRAPARWERYVAEAFVAGIAKEGVRAVVEGGLDREGWTWARVSENVKRIADQGKRKRKRRKRYIVPPEEMEEYMNLTP
ncbi:MAG: hypothetical protein M1830_001433 [Pleopsidium flavum]|nr:MAG: hypothetical protein M1830_001433 [Pleopsidium flavum]